MGNITAFFNMIFLIKLLFDSVQLRKKIIYFMFYVLSAVLVFGSHSATGVIIFLVLNFATILGFFWLRWYSRIKLWHYYFAGAFMLIAAIILITNIGFFFGLLGRSANMTGRIPLWQDLFLNIWSRRPILGYGYGALWMQESFRELMKNSQGWTLFPVFFADNGFLDILLNLGLLGFLPFLAMFGAYGVRSFQKVVATRSWRDMVPLLSFIYFLVGNIAYSFFLEVDQFVWMVLIILVFATTKLEQLGDLAERKGLLQQGK